MGGREIHLVPVWFLLSICSLFFGFVLFYFNLLLFFFLRYRKEPPEVVIVVYVKSQRPDILTLML